MAFLTPFWTNKLAILDASFAPAAERHALITTVETPCLLSRAATSSAGTSWGSGLTPESSLLNMRRALFEQFQPLTHSRQQVFESTLCHQRLHEGLGGQRENAQDDIAQDDASKL